MIYYKPDELTFLEHINKKFWGRTCYNSDIFNNDFILLYTDNDNYITYKNIEQYNIKLISKILNKKWCFE